MEYLRSSQPIRVCISVTCSSPYWHTPEDSLGRFLQEVKYEITENQVRLLVKQIWPRHVFLVYDFFHVDYDHKIAHLPDNNHLPVMKVDFRNEITIRLAGFEFRTKVNEEVARMHNLNGFKEPPYSDDHCGETAPVYLNPRDVSLL